MYLLNQATVGLNDFIPAGLFADAQNLLCLPAAEMTALRSMLLTLGLLPAIAMNPFDISAQQPGRFKVHSVVVAVQICQRGETEIRQQFAGHQALFDFAREAACLMIQSHGEIGGLRGRNTRSFSRISRSG